METAIGVFASRDRAENACKELLTLKVPEDSIIFLTPEKSDAAAMGASVGGTLGGATGLSLGVAVASTLVLPGIGAVFALGFGAAALLGLIGAGAGAAMGSAVHTGAGGTDSTPQDRSRADTALFRNALKEGRSLVVVRTESQETVATACSVLDRLGLGMSGDALDSAN
ncbi:MAG TPA: hypothetical protein VOA64_04815 [Candidatus Dormibacteraeota bacterium]|nr:hypothetical protein [Candidatus Dormibacteraeota bacterium]